MALPTTGVALLFPHNDSTALDDGIVWHCLAYSQSDKDFKI